MYVITEWYDARLTVGRLVRTAGKVTHLGLGSQKARSESIKSTLDSLEPKFL